MSDEGLTLSERGFAQYGETTCTYGSKVQVYESSSAEAPHIWLNVAQDPEVMTPRYDAVAHLSLTQARAVRDALTVAIERAESLWDEEDWT